MKHLHTLVSQRTNIRYTLVQRMGKGAFGVAWKAIPQKGRRPRAAVCLKLTRDSESWHRECYFAEILRGYSGVIQMSDEFVHVRGQSRVFCSAFELATGSVYDLRSEWEPRHALREFRRIVEATAALHRMGAVHRDITPKNVLLKANRTLVLADFGIALHGVDKPVKADCFNPWFAPDSKFRESANWGPRDDVWQLGQLLVFLMVPTIEDPIRPADLAKLEIPDNAKALIYRSIAPRQHRLEHAGRLLDIWDSAGIPFSRTSRISQCGIVFTGRGSLPRWRLVKLSRRAGAIPQRKVSGKTDLVVVGDNSSLWAAGSEGGKKILAAFEERDRGSPLRFIREETFLAAVKNGRN